MDDKVNVIKRSHIDDIARRNGSKLSNRIGAMYDSNESYRNRMLNGRKSTFDEYTGERIFLEGRYHFTHNTINVDHIEPIKKIIDDNSFFVDKGLLSTTDMKDRANSDWNLAIINESLNKTKGKNSNHQVIIKDLSHGTIDPLKAARMLKAQVIAETTGRFHTGLTVATKGVEKVLPDTLHLSKTNTFKYFRSESSAAFASGLDVGITTGVMSSFTNIVAVSTGAKSKEEAIEDVLKDTGSAVIAGSTLKLLEKPVNQIVKTTLGKQVGHIASPQIAMILSSGSSIVRCINGEISTESCVVEILGNVGATYVSSLAVSAMGGPVTVIGVGVALLVSAIASCVIDTVLSSMNQANISAQQANAYYHRVNGIINEAIHTIHLQRERIYQYIENSNEEYKENVINGFNQMILCALESDIDGINKGLEQIMSHFGIAPRFNTLEEFDSLFYDESSVFKL